MTRRAAIVAALLAALLFAGCSCISHGDDGTFVDPGEYKPPIWEKVN